MIIIGKVKKIMELIELEFWESILSGKIIVVEESKQSKYGKLWKFGYPHLNISIIRIARKSRHHKAVH